MNAGKLYEKLSKEELYIGFKVFREEWAKELKHKGRCIMDRTQTVLGTLCSCVPIVLSLISETQTAKF